MRLLIKKQSHITLSDNEHPKNQELANAQLEKSFRDFKCTSVQAYVSSRDNRRDNIIVHQKKLIESTALEEVKDIAEQIFNSSPLSKSREFRKRPDNNFLIIIQHDEENDSTDLEESKTLTSTLILKCLISRNVIYASYNFINGSAQSTTAMAGGSSNRIEP